jgi:hypothetical protein
MPKVVGTAAGVAGEGDTADEVMLLSLWDSPGPDRRDPDGKGGPGRLKRAVTLGYIGGLRGVRATLIY